MKKMLTGMMILVLNSIAQGAGPLDNLPASVVTLHQVISGNNCDSDLTSTPEVHILDSKHKTTLYIVPCTQAAYNTMQRAYISYDDGKYAEPVTVLSFDGIGIAGTMELDSAGYDPTSMTLSTFFKGRGIGDCGESSKSKLFVNDLGGVSMRTVEIRSKANCDGHPEKKWPVVFKQK